MTGGVNVPVTSTWDPKGVRAAEKDVSGFQKQANASLGAIGKSFAGFGVGIAAGLGANFVKDQIAQAIGAASDLAESQGKVNVVFGKSATEISKWADTSATALLMTKQQALEAAGTYGNLFQAFGLGQEQATDMSKKLVQLAADLASFNNTSVDDAILALRSGLSGEVEPLKRYGVALNDVRLRQQALSMGIYKGTGVLNSSQKAQAAYALILHDTALAQGDVARTANGFANTTRALTAAVGNAQAAIGGGLLSGIQSTSAALGGPQGMVSLIDSVAQNSATAAENIGRLTSSIAGLGAMASDVGAKSPGWLQWLFDQDHTADWSWLRTFGFGGSMLTPVVQSFDLAETAVSDYTDAVGKTGDGMRSLYEIQLAQAANQKAFVAPLDDINSSAKDAKSSIDLLTGALKTLYGQNQSREEARLGLKQLREEGPGKSGSRTVTVPGDKKVVTLATGEKVVTQGTKKKTVQFATEDDARRWAISYAQQAGEYAATFSDPFKQAKVLQGAQSFIAGQVGRFGVERPKMFAAGLIGPQAAGFSRPWERQYAAGALPPTAPTYNFTVIAQPGSVVDQITKEGKRKVNRSGGRYVVPTGARR